MEDHAIYILVVVGGIIIGILQAITIFFVRIAVSKILDICRQVSALQVDMVGKIGIGEHQRIELEMAKIGNRVYKIEVALKIEEAGN